MTPDLSDLLDYEQRRELTGLLVEWRGAGEAVASSAYAIADAFDRAVSRIADAWVRAAEAVEDRAGRA